MITINEFQTIFAGMDMQLNYILTNNCWYLKSRIYHILLFFFFNLEADSEICEQWFRT